MKKLDDVYHEILDDIKELPCGFGINEINELIKPKYKWFGIIEIINEIQANMLKNKAGLYSLNRVLYRIKNHLL